MSFLFGSAVSIEDMPALFLSGRRLRHPGLRAAVIALAVVAALAGCAASDCTYYGRPSYNTPCAVVGPSPIGGNN